MFSRELMELPHGRLIFFPQKSWQKPFIPTQSSRILTPCIPTHFSCVDMCGNLQFTSETLRSICTPHTPRPALLGGGGTSQEWWCLVLPSPFSDWNVLLHILASTPVVSALQVATCWPPVGRCHAIYSNPNFRNAPNLMKIVFLINFWT